jgi:hypothetical protein
MAMSRKIGKWSGESRPFPYFAVKQFLKDKMAKPFYPSKIEPYNLRMESIFLQK